MDLSEPLHDVQVRLRKSLWMRLRDLAARRKTSMSQLCADWIRVGVATAETERGRGLAEADDVSPAA